MQVVDKHAPVLTFRKKRDSHPWVTGDILQMIQKGNFFKGKFQQTKIQSFWETYKLLRNQVTKALRAAKADFFKNVCCEIGENPRKAWSQLNTLIGQKTNKVNSIVYDNLFLQDNKSIADDFNNHFASVVESSSVEQSPPSCSLPPVDTCLSFLISPKGMC